MSWYTSTCGSVPDREQKGGGGGIEIYIRSPTDIDSLAR